MMRFLAGDGVMARMIRARDWTQHPLGPPEQWPQSLRSAISICLHSAFPTAIYWGPDLRLLYNDAWIPIPGPRHPDALGAPAREVWADIWDVIEPQFEHLLATGEGIFVENQLLPMRRYGLPEETYWNYSFTPIRGEAGEIVGVFNSGSETTRAVRAQREASYLLELEEALRKTGDPRRAFETGAEMLRRHLGVEDAELAEIGRSRDGEAIVLESAWSRSSSALLSLALPALNGEVGAAPIPVGDLAITDAAAPDAAAAPSVREGLAAMNARGLLTVHLPWDEDRALIAILTTREPRGWGEFDQSACRETLTRVGATVERVRAAERERAMVREIDHRARNALATALSIIRLSKAETIDELRDKVADRIAALARVHGLLASERWVAVDLRQLVEQELLPQQLADGERVSIVGGRARLAPDIAQAVTLVLHELATNAARRGAFRSGADGVAVSWEVDAQGAVHLDWRERGTAPADGDGTAASTRVFGSTLLERIVRAQLGGELERSREGNVLRCKVSFPLEGRRGGSDAPAVDTRRVKPNGMRVMIAEDETLVAMDMESLLLELGYQPLGVYGTVDAAMAAARDESPDLAILDANLRGKSSVPIALELALKRVPVVFATGYSGVPELPDSLASVPTIRKPVSEDALASAIETACRMSTTS